MKALVSFFTAWARQRAEAHWMATTVLGRAAMNEAAAKQVALMREGDPWEGKHVNRSRAFLETEAMLCETCRGTRVVRTTVAVRSIGGVVWYPEPCPDCIGGQQHCCEGETAANELRDVDRRAARLILVQEPEARVLSQEERAEMERQTLALHAEFDALLANGGGFGGRHGPKQVLHRRAKRPLKEIV